MKRFPSPTTRTDPVSRVFAGILLAAVLAMLLSLSVPRGAFAQEAPSGLDVGEDGVSINGGHVFAGDGCAKAGDVVLGDCEDGKAKTGDGPSEDDTGDPGASEDAEGTGAGTESDPAATEAPDGGCAVKGPVGETTTTTVERTIDGDTVETPEGTVRLIGVDTPETVDPNEGPEPGGEEASEFTAEELEGEEVELKLGTEPKDEYSRTLAYLWTEDERGEPAMFNETLLREGLGELLIIPPNDEYERCLASAEKAAQDEGAGVWAEDAGGADQIPADSPPEPEISAGADQYGEDAEPVIVETEDAAPTAGENQYEQAAGEDQYEEAATELPPPAPTDETEIREPEVQELEIQEEEIQEPEIQEPEVQEEEVREARARSSELAGAPAELPAEIPVQTSAELPAPAATTPITTLPETGGASVASLAAGTPLLCSGLLAAWFARTPRRPDNATAGERDRS